MHLYHVACLDYCNSLLYKIYPTVPCGKSRRMPYVARLIHHLIVVLRPQPHHARSASVALTSCPDIESPSNSRACLVHRSLSGHTSAFLAGDIYSSSLKANVASFACLRPGYRAGNGSMGQHGSVHVDP